MELEKASCKIRCEMGACRNMASHTIKMSRVGIGSRIHICGECLEELYCLIGKDLIPKSIETVGRPKIIELVGGAKIVDNNFNKVSKADEVVKAGKVSKVVKAGKVMRVGSRGKK